MNRRRYLKVGLGATLVGGLYVGRHRLVRPDEGGPQNLLDWECTFQDHFDADQLDTDHWGIGWGWGRTTTTSPTRITPDNVAVHDSDLRLSGAHEGDEVTAGAVNTKDSVTFGPGSYLEAKITFANRVGFLNAFWSKPNSEAWPPEIDVVELWQDGSGPHDTHVSHHHLHYSGSMVPGDDSTHVNNGVPYRPGDDLTENYHIYAVEWLPDEIVHYVDGTPVKSWTDDEMLEAMRRGAPFYLMFSLNVDRIGTADRTEPWTEAMAVDWVRLWERR